jgi:chromatin segregation and condensation protein Rec8/ScpA/Scc1 (kleisin family)
VVSERDYSLLSVAEREKFTMPPRRERQSPDPEDREVRRRGRPVGNPEMERQMRDLRARLEEMETAQRRTASAGDLSDSEGEVEAEHEEEVAAEDASTERLIKAIARWVRRQRWTFQSMREIWMQKSY